MRKITEITRRDIFDLIRDGIETFWNESKIYYYGRLNEIEFLIRLYDLENMPSTDNRYRKAIDDIKQHTLNNFDWNDCWVLSDTRFKLTNGNDDEYLLKFICEMFHPAVRVKNQDYVAYLQKFNDLLIEDGYEIYEYKNISGRAVYNYREIDHIEIDNPYEKMSSTLISIGEGSYAKVYKYEDSFYNKTLVLKRAKKELTDKELERFKREFEEMKKLNSPYILNVFCYNEEKHEYIMEYMDTSLYDYIISNNDKIENRKRNNIINQILKGIKYLHSKSILHRDISPKNILLKFYDDVIVVKISDFGLVKIPESDLTSENSELKGCLNDPALKVEGFTNYNVMHETYALTLLIAFIITGKMNFSNIKDKKLKDFIDKGTNIDKTKRFQNIEEIIKALPI